MYIFLIYMNTYIIYFIYKETYKDIQHTKPPFNTVPMETPMVKMITSLYM